MLQQLMSSAVHIIRLLLVQNLNHYFNILALLFVICCVVATSDDSTTTAGNNSQQYYLDENSVVVITGAAGFIGSELAIALHQTYNVKKLICIDSMERGFGTSTSQKNSHTHSSSHTANNNKEHELALFEYKRQRLFRLIQQTGGTAYYYRVDFRPSIPEYFDGTEVPVLHHIFTREHPDITHVVHLADHYHHGTAVRELSDQQQVIPRIRGSEKAGMMESLLEQLQLQNSINPKKQPIHFVYASSGDVYDIFPAKDSDVTPLPNPPPFREELPITTPSTIAGTSKLIDEILAQTYYEINNNLKSIGLRFFQVYGPWGLPGSAIFELAEEAVKKIDNDDESDPFSLTKSVLSSDLLDHVKDYVYIDDAVDAIMAAMQFASPKGTTVFNVGSGYGTTLRSIAKMMKEIVGDSDNQNEDYVVREPPPTVSIANLDRSKAVLGYEPVVSLQEGIEKTLAWHYDRVYPYGTGMVEDKDKEHIGNKGMVACTSPYDTDCLRGSAIFPCASECAHRHQCIKTLYDDVMELSRTITSECKTVMYTVSLDTALSDIPSVHVRVSTQSIGYVQEGGGYCNIAFVPDTSPLYQQAAQKVAAAATNTATVMEGNNMDQANQKDGNNSIVKYGFWTLVPVAVTEYVNNNNTSLIMGHNRNVLEMIPKLSPGLFFGSKTEHAIYCDMDIIFYSIPRLVQEANMQPQQQRKNNETATNAGKNDNNRKGSTVMLIGKVPESPSLTKLQKRQRQAASSKMASPQTTQAIQQEMTYRVVRMAVIDEMMGDGFAQKVDSSFIVHNNIRRKQGHPHDNDDARFFRCDIIGEVLQWNVPTDAAAIEFIMGLHDMWSRVMVEKSGTKPWWIGDDVMTVPSEFNYATTDTNNLEIKFDDGNINNGKPQSKSRRHRRLKDMHKDLHEEQQLHRLVPNSHRRLQEIDSTEDHQHRRLLETEEDEGDGLEDVEEDDDEEKTEVNGGEHNGFGVVQDALQAVFGGIGQTNKEVEEPRQQHKQVERFEHPVENGDEEDGKEFDDFVVNDDDADNKEDDDAINNAAGFGFDMSNQNKERRHPRQRRHPKEQQPPLKHHHDPSSYDVWMGILSSTNIRYYSRIVSLQAVGAYRINHHDDNEEL